MTVRHHQFLSSLVLGAVLLLGSGCGSSPDTRFYVLDAVVQPAGTPLELSVGLGPVTLPPYIDRNPIVTRDGPNTLSLAEFDRWAEPMQDGFERVLTTDLAAALGTSGVEMHPWGASAIDIRVPVEVLRFDADASGTVYLVARWAVLTPDHGMISPPRLSEISHASSSSSFADTVGGLSQAIGKLAVEISRELRSAHGAVRTAPR